MHFLLRGSSQKIVVSMYCISQYVVITKKQLIGHVNDWRSASDVPFMSRQISCGLLEGFCFCCFLGVNKISDFFFKSLVANLTESFSICKWAVLFVTGVWEDMFFSFELVNRKTNPAQNSWEIHKKRPTLLMSPQLPVINLCLWNKIPFWCHVFLL